MTSPTFALRDLLDTPRTSSRIRSALSFGIVLLIGAVGSGRMVSADDKAVPAVPGVTQAAWLSPSAMTPSADGKSLYLALATGNQVGIFDLATSKISRSINIPGTPSGLVLNRDGSRLYVTCAGPTSTVCVVDVAAGTVIATMPAGHTATSPVLSPDGKTLFVVERFNARITSFDVQTNKPISSIPVDREPITAAITPDGTTLLVAHHLSSLRDTPGTVAASVSVIDLSAGKVAGQLVLPNGSGLLRQIVISGDGHLAVVVHNLARFQMPTTQLDRGWMNTSAITLIDVPVKKIINTVLLDDVDHGAANPWALSWASGEKSLLVTLAGVGELSILDMPGLLAKLAAVTSTPKPGQPEVCDDLSFLVGLKRRVKLVGSGPRSLVVLGQKAYVGQYFTDSLDVVDLEGDAHKVQTLPLHEPLAMSVERRGEMFFNDAALSFQGWQSCASCHSEDARVDGLNWDLLNDGIGNPKNTKSLLLSHRTPPAMSLGIRETAETAVRAGIRHILMTEQPEETAVALDTWLKSLGPVPSPHLVDGQLSPSALRGKQLFESAEVGCAHCHKTELFTDLAHHDVGTHGEFDRTDTAFDTPTLREIWRTAPYLHDGSAASVRDVLITRNPHDQHGSTSKLTKEQIDDLIEYLLSL